MQVKISLNTYVYKNHIPHAKRREQKPIFHINIIDENFEQCYVFIVYHQHIF